MIVPAAFAIIVGLGMVVQWTLSWRADQIAELQTEPIRIRFHIAGEMVTALALMAGGAGLLLHAAWSVPLYLVAMGMLFYTAIVSPGYFAAAGRVGVGRIVRCDYRAGVGLRLAGGVDGSLPSWKFLQLSGRFPFAVRQVPCRSLCRWHVAAWCGRLLPVGYCCLLAAWVRSFGCQVWSIMYD